MDRLMEINNRLTVLDKEINERTKERSALKLEQAKLNAPFRVGDLIRYPWGREMRKAVVLDFIIGRHDEVSAKIQRINKGDSLGEEGYVNRYDIPNCTIDEKGPCW